jgi:hypothetical protein
MDKHVLNDMNANDVMQRCECNAVACQSGLLYLLEHLSGCTVWREIKSTPNKGHGMDHVILNINHPFRRIMVYTLSTPEFH